MDLKETLKFNHTIILLFSDLTRNLQNKIYQKLSQNDFFNYNFEVINIINFYVKQMLVQDKYILCNLDITAVCNNPTKGKIIKISDFEVTKTSIIYINGRIQIIAKYQGVPKQSYSIKIEDSKMFSKNILCVATIID